MPKAVYPKSLITTSGHARVSLNIHSDGSVSDVKALSATKPAFGEAAVEAARQWRFKPWTAGADRPAVIDAQNDMIFTPELGRTDTVQLTFSQTTFQSCSKLSEEVSQFQHDHPNRPLIDMKSFAITRVAVMFPALSGKSDYIEGLERADQLEKVLPRVVRKCQANPRATFADFLPANLKRYL
ncbi:energy transducer TonB [Pseudomonas sp. 15FMM2]|uniref:Energy transducer TonB n=1 Tax=Pseudomonas imrae TaxID=2992837 RepID=A0ACC7PI89_9PSED